MRQTETTEVGDGPDVRDAKAPGEVLQPVLSRALSPHVEAEPSLPFVQATTPLQGDHSSIIPQIDLAGFLHTAVAPYSVTTPSRP